MRLPIFRSRKEKRLSLEEAVREAHLEKAERELETFKERADGAIRALTERNQRNHWRESIEQIIQGA